MKTKFVVLMLSIYFISISICNSQEQITNYVNDEYKYSIDYPENWVMETRETINHVVSFYTPDTTKVKRGAIKVIIMEIEGDENLESRVERLVSPIKEFLAKDFIDIRKDMILINGLEFYLYDCSFNYKNQNLPDRQRNFNCYNMQNGKIYSVMFWGHDTYFEQNEDLIMKSIESFKLLR